jgi:hypothetical protein
MATFEEVLAAFPDTPLNVDMKSYGPDPSVSLAAADALAEIMNRHPERSEDVIVASFDQAAIERFHELAPGHKALSGSLDGTVPYAFGGPISPAPVAIQPPDLFEFGSVVRTVPLLKPFTDYDGFALHVWGSDKDPEQESDAFYARLIEEGADGFFTQSPGKLHQYLCEAGIRRPDGSQRCSSQAPDVAPVLRVYSFRGSKGLPTGRRSTFAVLLGNTGNTAMKDAKACVTVAKKDRRKVRGSCATRKSLRPGDLATLRLSVTPNRRARGNVRLTLQVTSDGGTRRVTRAFRLIRPNACSKKGGKGGGSGGLLCGTTDHL